MNTLLKYLAFVYNFRRWRWGKAGFVNGLRYARDNGYLAPGLTAQNGRENPKS